jgi:predicted transcriptional regulator
MTSEDSRTAGTAHELAAELSTPRRAMDDAQRRGRVSPLTVEEAAGMSQGELVEAAKREHAAVEAALTSALDHAISCGRAICRLREMIPPGEWIAFTQEQIPFSKGSYVTYMRLAHYADRFAGRPISLTEARAEIVGLPGPFPQGRQPKRDPALRAIAREMVESGTPRVEVAKHFEVSPSTITNWLMDPEEWRERIKARNQTQASKLKEQRAAEAALRRERAVRAAKSASDPLAETYSLVRRACQQADRAHSSADLGRRRAIGLAVGALHEAEEHLVRAMGYVDMKEAA